MSHTYPILTVDIVLFTIKDDALHLLLSKRTNDTEAFPNQWALPGGYVHVNEDLNLIDTATRILQHKINIRKHLYLEQLETFSGPDRDPRGWSISQAFCAIIPFEDLQATPEIQWINVKEIQTHKLPFDHNLIAARAIERLQSKSSYSTLPIHFFKGQFTLSELQKVYEIILQQKLDKSSFRKRLDDMNMLTLIKGSFKGGAQRPAQLYKIKTDTTSWFKSTL